MAGKFEILKSTAGNFRFNLKAGNGQIILSSESYETKAAAQNGAESVKKNAADESRFDRRKNKNGDSYFVLKAGNGQEIGRSESYSSEAGLENGIQSVRNNAPEAEIVDLTEA